MRFVQRDIVISTELIAGFANSAIHTLLLVDMCIHLPRCAALQPQSSVSPRPRPFPDCVLYFLLFSRPTGINNKIKELLPPCPKRLKEDSSGPTR